MMIFIVKMEETNQNQQQQESVPYPLDQVEQQHVRTIEIDDSVNQYTKGSNNWYFVYTEQEKMIGSAQLDQVQKYLDISHVPEMLFG